MAEDTGQSRSEAASQRRREDARKRGQVAFSSDLSNGLLLFAGTGILWMASGSMGRSMMTSMKTWLLYAIKPELSTGDTVSIFQAVASRALDFGGLLIGLLFLVGLGVAAMQVGIGITFEPLSPNWERLSPTKGWQKLFSMRSAARGIAAILKVAIIALLILWILRGRFVQIANSGQGTLQQAISVGWSVTIMISLAISASLVILGMADFFFQRWRHEEDLKMTMQEVKDERKEDEGDPHLKARLRKLQREIGQRRMLQDVPGATVVVTNPTHFAVALRYERGETSAPVVVAKGADLLARQIRRIAEQHDVPILERKPLARALYASVDVGQEIPADFYQAIAEILAYVYRLKNAA